MNRRRMVLALLLAILPFATLLAQESRIVPSVPDTGRLVPAKQVEPGLPPATADMGAVDGAVVMEGEYTPSFGERMAGFREALFKPLTFSWFDGYVNSDGDLMTSDLEDPYWFRADLMWGWFKKASTPALITTSSPQTSRGIIGQPGTRVLFGGDIDLQTHLGPRVTGGFWLDPTQSWGFEGSYFFFSNRSTYYHRFSQGGVLLASPYIDALTGQQSAIPIANEELEDGSLDQLIGIVDFGTHSRIQGAEFNNIHNIRRRVGSRLDWTWGFRWIELDETVFTDYRQQQVNGAQSHVWDDFGTANNFYGLNLGLRSQWYFGSTWSLDITGKLGLGAMRGTITIDGYTQTAVPPQFIINTERGGLYAQASNVGRTTDIRFGVVPEIEIALGYYFWDHWRFTMGYNFMAMTNVVRPGDQIDNRINPNIFNGQTGGPNLPEPLNKTSTFYLNTLSLGLEIRY
ncbi:MAG: BBP7 family outer membrane beta-barrel protein [Planctomycetia bacterium]|nr:BBP7 family outer membrane beta-barrel protein [Planctomycetia bacterium]